MNREFTSYCIAGLMACVLYPSVATAAVWNSSGEENWSTATNWDTGVAPNLETGNLPAVIKSGTVVSGSLIVRGSSTLTLDGGSVKGESWPRVDWGGKVFINSGTFTVGYLVLGNYPQNPTSGGFINVNGGTLQINNRVGFSAGSVLTLKSGLLSMTNNTSIVWNEQGGGVYAPDTGYINFTAGSTAVIFISGDTSGTKATSMLNSGYVRYDGTVVNATSFLITKDSTGSYITQIVSVPEAASLSLIGISSVMLLFRTKAEQ